MEKGEEHVEDYKKGNMTYTQPLFTEKHFFLNRLLRARINEEIAIKAAEVWYAHEINNIKTIPQ